MWIKYVEFLEKKQQPKKKQRGLLLLWDFWLFFLIIVKNIGKKYGKNNNNNRVLFRKCDISKYILQFLIWLLFWKSHTIWSSW